MHNLYDIDQCRAMQRKIKSITITVPRKNTHYPKVEEIRQLLYDCMLLNKYLFDPSYDYQFQAYSHAVNVYYKSTTKKRLDHLLRYIIQTLYNQIEELIDVEYQTRDGRLILKNDQWIEAKGGQLND